MNLLLRSAVERQFEIMGEALTNLRRLDPSLAQKIDDLPAAIAFRNILAHRYSDVDDRIVWSIIEDRLPNLLATFDRLLAP